MKRIAAFFLTVCLLSAAAAPAFAREPLRFAARAMNLVEDWLGEHYPDIPFENLYERDGEESLRTARVLQALQREDGPDLLMLDSSVCDFGRVLASGLLSDLSANEDIGRAVSQMYEPFGDFVSGGDGGIYGVLYGVYAFAMHAVPAAWEAAGLSDGDRPGSFEELLDFVGRWTSLVEAGDVGDVRLNSLRGYPQDSRRYTLWLMEVLMESWIMRCQAAGEETAFDVPEFVSLADSVRRTGYALGQAEEMPGGDSLFLYDDGLKTGMGYGEQDLFSNAFPMRVTADEPVRVRAYGFLFAVRRDSPYAQVAAEFIADQTCHTGTERRNCKLYREIPETQFTPPEGVDGYVLTRQWQEAYRPEWLFFTTSPFDTARASQEKETLLSRFALGEITAGELAAALDGLCREE